MGMIKDIVRDLIKEPLIPRKKKSAECKAAGQEKKVVKPKVFCDPVSVKPCVTVCRSGASCNCGCEAVEKALRDEITRRGLKISVGYLKSGCDGSCSVGALLGFPAKGFFYVGVTPERIPEIVEETLEKGNLLFPLLSLDTDRSYRADLLYDKDSGFLAAIDDSVSMVEAAKYFMEFESGLSCGKCVPCRIGLKRMVESLEKIASGEGTNLDIDAVKDLGCLMKEAPFCEFAAASCRPALTALARFEDEFKAVITVVEVPPVEVKPAKPKPEKEAKVEAKVDAQPAVAVVPVEPVPPAEPEPAAETILVEEAAPVVVTEAVPASPPVPEPEPVVVEEEVSVPAVPEQPEPVVAAEPEPVKEVAPVVVAEAPAIQEAEVPAAAPEKSAKADKPKAAASPAKKKKKSTGESKSSKKK